MDITYDSEALFADDDINEREEIEKNATPSEEQILNDLLKKDERKIRRQRLVRNPKLRDIELCGPNGFFELKRSFDNFIPKNKNPYDDLLVMMSRIEHWGHLLCPKMTFEDFVSHVESLSDKRMVKTMLTKMRLDMPLTDEDFLGNKENKQDNEIADKGGSKEFTDMLLNDTDLFEIFDDTPSVSVTSHQTATLLESSTSKLSWEQLQRIEKNKHRAQEIRMQREKRMSELDGFNSVLKNDDSPVLEEIASNITLNSKSFIQDENSEKSQEHVDIMMDDSEALDFIFSST
uniref:TIMELESS-interacting protein n=1 Tax=Wuchereria bancrofti TaxID=6293 RepID=A0A1I8EN70_WUCBA